MKEAAAGVYPKVNLKEVGYKKVDIKPNNFQLR
jgi:hypothetical protein